MKLSKLTENNLYRDRRVLGEKWKGVYGGYFANPKVFAAFIRVSRKLFASLPNKTKILYVCSGTGELGEVVCDYLKSIGKSPSLTMVDVSTKQLKQNKNRKTRKVNCDISFMDLGETFDLIIMRSALHYFSTPKSQTRVLKQIVRHLSPNGVFINQCPILTSKIERDIADSIHASTPKMGKRHFQCPTDIASLYAGAGMRATLIGKAPRIVITAKSHSDRYGLVKKEVEVIRRLISRVPQALRPNIKLTKTGYVLFEAFPIYCGIIQS